VYRENGVIGVGVLLSPARRINMHTLYPQFIAMAAQPIDVNTYDSDVYVAGNRYARHTATHVTAHCPLLSSVMHSTAEKLQVVPQPLAVSVSVPGWRLMVRRVCAPACGLFISQPIVIKLWLR